jgi:hypothetical protein
MTPRPADRLTRLYERNRGSKLIYVFNEHGTAIRHRIYMMGRRITAVLALLVCFTVDAWAIDGTFQGRVIDPPTNQPQLYGWIYVQGRNHTLRRVEVSHAAIVFGENVPVSQHRKCSMECLTAGQVIRVTAEQDHSGEWRAKRIEILKLTSHRI